MSDVDACPSRDLGRHIYRDGFCIFCDGALPRDPILDAAPHRKTRAEHNAAQEEAVRCGSPCQVPNGDGCGGRCGLEDAHDGACRCATCECEWGSADGCPTMGW